MGRSEPFINLEGDKYIFGDCQRLFLNNSLGCISRCEYCYLPTIGYPIGTRIIHKISAEELLEVISRRDLVIPGKKGTIISLGCYSECWSEENIAHTTKIIEHFINKGNPVQMATKRYVNCKELKQIAARLQWPGQLTICVSCATISSWNTVEKGTINPYDRFQTFKISSIFDIPTYLYIKPVLPGITKIDKTSFGCIMAENQVNAIVGSQFIHHGAGPIAPIGDGVLCYSNNGYNQDELEMRAYLSDFGRVYTHSIDPINEWRSFNG